MGYKWRKTKGWTDCRPKAYRHFHVFPRPSSICTSRCIYSMLCNMEFNKKNMTLGERIKNVRLTLQRPFHIFSYLPNDEEIMLVLEGAESNIPRLSFRGKSIVDAVSNAEKYIENERNMGTLQKPSEENEENDKNENEDKNESEDQDAIG